MYCYNCGKEIRDDSKFCYACGKAVDKQTSDKPVSGGISKFLNDHIKMVLIIASVIIVMLVIVILCIIISGNKKADVLENISKETDIKDSPAKETISLGAASEVKGQNIDDLPVMERINEEENEEEIKEDEEKEETEDNVEREQTVKKRETAFDFVKGHYEDEMGDCVDIYSPDYMTRYIRGGHQSHTYVERIHGFRFLEDGTILIEIQWDDGMCNTYLYVEDGDCERLFFGEDMSWDPGFPYQYNEVQLYEKKSDYSDEEYGIWDGEEYCFGSCYLEKRGDDYYLCASTSDDYLWYNGEKTNIYIGDGLKIAKGAKVGVAKGVDFMREEPEVPYETAYYSYDFYDLYSKVDWIYQTKHWRNIEGMIHFSVDDIKDIPNVLMIRLNENDEVIQIRDYYNE